MRKSNPRPRLDGVLLVDKPEGPTSHDVVLRVRRALGQRRMGHAGTLDPFATGLLVLCLGHATRLVQFVGSGPKLYEGTVLLGVSTDTDDITGQHTGDPVPEPPPREEIQRSLEILRGRREQTPPAFSAKRVGGVRAYRRARRGQNVLLRPVPVTIHELEILFAEGPRIGIRASVSPGTYMRALARDLGLELGLGACLESLRRLSSGPFRVEEAARPDDPPGRLTARLLPLDQVPLGLASLAVSHDAASRLSVGRPVRWPEGQRAEDSDGELLRVLDPDGRLLGIGRVSIESTGGRLVHPQVVFPRQATG
jgi:tRNA pseudouridine55 synthase